MVKLNKSGIYFKGSNKEFRDFIKDYFFLDITLKQYLKFMDNSYSLKMNI